jgi:hypothetical protein
VAGASVCPSIRCLLARNFSLVCRWLAARSAQWTSGCGTLGSAPRGHGRRRRSRASRPARTWCCPKWTSTRSTCASGWAAGTLTTHTLCSTVARVVCDVDFSRQAYARLGGAPGRSVYVHNPQHLLHQSLRDCRQPGTHVCR